MTSFVNIKYSTQHPGVVRAESAFGAVRQLGHAFSGTRGLATLLLSAIAAAVMVVAYQVMDSVAEGVPTTKSLVELAKRFNVEMPITMGVYQILFEGKDAIDALTELMSRDPKPEKLG